MQTLIWTLFLASAGSQADALRPDGRPGTVTLPLDEYERLLDRAARPARQPEAPPVPALLSRAEVQASVAGATARGVFTIEGEVLARGTARVPLVSGLTLLQARAGGKPLPLVGEAGGLSALLGGPGPFSLELEWAAPVTSEPGRASFVLPVPKAGSVRATLTVPGEHDVRLEPGLVTRRSVDRGQTRIEATLEPGSQARVSWTAREANAAPAGPARLLAELRTLVTVGEGELRLAVLVDVTVVEGAPEHFTLELPRGFELVSVSGPSLETTAETPGELRLQVREPARRAHQFVLSLQRATEGSFESAVPFVALRGAARESGELAVSGIGTLEVAARESGTLRRMDPSESSAALRALSVEPLLSAFRYQRHGTEAPALALGVQRFPAEAVLVALAEHAVATTLVTPEGRTLTELKLTVRNQAQPFLKVGLPAGTTLLSAEVAGQAVKPVLGDDGTRVPLLRAGFRPSGPYEVSFVYLLPGAPFGKRGDAQLALPKLDLPVSLLEWELFLPDRYEVKRFEGDALPLEVSGLGLGLAGLMAQSGGFAVGASTASGGAGAPLAVTGVIGRVTDERGAPIPGATLTLRTQAGGAARTTTSDANGWYSFAGLAPDQYQLRCELAGFSARNRRVLYTGGRYVAHCPLSVAAVMEQLEVQADGPDELEGDKKDVRQMAQNAPSSNVFALQRRVAGVLPVRVEVPREGESHRFVRALVFEEETSLRFAYKARRR